jgi:hypothetical protein
MKMVASVYSELQLADFTLAGYTWFMSFSVLIISVLISSALPN